MAEVKILDNPSDALVEKAKAEHAVTDSRGRVIVLRKPSVLAQFRMVEALGDAAKNEVYMAMTMPLIFVASIDSNPVPPIATKREIEALIQRLDEEGIEAVMNGVQTHFGAVDPEKDKAAIKN